MRKRNTNDPVPNGLPENTAISVPGQLGLQGSAVSSVGGVRSCAAALRSGSPAIRDTTMQSLILGRELPGGDGGIEGFDTRPLQESCIAS